MKLPGDTYIFLFPVALQVVVTQKMIVVNPNVNCYSNVLLLWIWYGDIDLCMKIMGDCQTSKHISDINSQ